MGSQTRGDHALRTDAQANSPGHAIIKLKECLNGTVEEPLDETPDVGFPQPPLQKDFRQVRRGLKEVLEIAGLEAA